ncbi:hypothetical protein PHMEG_00031392, partial [Phytophthora megakarya]
MARRCLASLLEPAQTLWRLAYPWKDERLWYNPADFVYIYRCHWRLWNNHRPTLWRWAFHAPIDDAGQRRKAKYDATAARLRFNGSLHFRSAFLEILKDKDDLFWYGGTPGKGCADAHKLTNGSPMENLITLWKHDKGRYDYTLKHALDPANIADYGYHHVTDIL